MSRELLLQRRFLRETYTIGKLSVDDNVFCDTLEDKVRDYNHDGDLTDAGEQKISEETAIPYGRYRVVVNYSPKFRRKLPRLRDVPSFDGILIHGGVSAKNTSGCILVGENKLKGKLLNSKYYIDILTSWIEMWQKDGIDTWITII